MITRVVLSVWAAKQLKKIPKYLQEKLNTWVNAIEQEGLEEVRKKAGYHDEPLHGSRKGQRSIRLNRAYRAIYVIKTDGVVEFVNIEEITKHGY